MKTLTAAGTDIREVLVRPIFQNVYQIEFHQPPGIFSVTLVGLSRALWLAARIRPGADVRLVHEIAALMLLDANPVQSELDYRDLHALCDRQLVLLERLASGVERPHLTEHGRAVLQHVANRCT
ncbi:hypothetical protein QCE63_34495 [Caballeronia sp. LZ065]|uniref:hypothetical protein n=1 Tax=Caballeronia sp. LZ065 TaxID=3038571 RepID=UPI0028625F5A|nr:hypothetical protein [Caballeronia sp. LZ065]MDR5784517.1 hypothetical protein [Caballeronia sp. LZ065]